MANTIKVTAADRTLYHVAAAHLGDATQWWRIAQLNGLSSPDLSAFTTPVPLIIPAVDSSLASGVPGVTA
ncbi:LysM peptidoglycan-binding domain-containing protein [Acetobacter okinawensis]|uniref:LysM peptidoglycan-binding domain-containing protein n=1 Tax=Acetobacter okinawensis TaxID=1076594 RepID=UPI0039EB49BF